MNVSRRERSERRLQSLNVGMPSPIDAIDAAALKLRTVRETAERAICLGVAGQLAIGLDLASSGMEIDRWEVRSHLTPLERELFAREPVPTALLLRHQDDGEASFALFWALGLADELPADLEEQAFEDARVQLLESSIGRDGGIADIVADARPRPAEEIADQIDYLMRYEAIYAVARPSWRTVSGLWVGPLAPESVVTWLRALRWYCDPAAGSWDASR